MSEVVDNVEYYNWLTSLVCKKNDIYNAKNYSNVLENLYNEEFYWLIPLDGNRARDGLALRTRYLSERWTSIDSKEAADPIGHLEGKCSVLEMLIAMCIRVETEIMYDPNIGDRTGMWFWQILKNLGLDNLSDNNYHDSTFYGILDIFLNRMYQPDGRGGPFYIPNTTYDLRKVEFWFQMNLYLSAFFIENLV